MKISDSFEITVQFSVSMADRTVEPALSDWSMSNENNAHSEEEEGKKLRGKMERLILAGKGELNLVLL